MKKRIIAVIFAALTGFGASFAQSEFKGMDTYNVQQAMEAMGQDDTAKAKSYFTKEIEENPKNGIGYLGMATLYANDGINDEAVKMLEKGIKVAKKNDKPLAAFLYSMLGEIYTELEQTDKALNAYESAMKLDKTDEDFVYAHIDILEDLERYSEQLPDIKILEKNFADNPVACVYVGRYYRNTKDNQKALLAYTRSISLSSEEYSTPFSFRAETLMEMEEWSEAAEDIVKAVAIDNDAKAIGEMGEMGKKAYDAMIAALQSQADSDAENPLWYYHMANLSTDAERYDATLDYFAKCLPLASDDDEEAGVSTADVFTMRSACYQQLGRFHEAYDDISKVLANDDSNFIARLQRMDLCYSLNDLDGAIVDADYLIEELPWFSMTYIQRAHYYMAKGDYVKAIEDLDTALAVDETSAAGLQSRSRCYYALERANDAAKDLDAILALDDEAVDGLEDAKAFAYAIRGQRTEALALCEKLYSEETKENFYNTACIYNILGDAETALDLLEKAFKAGYRNVTHASYDEDLRSLHGNPRFEQLMKDYAVDSTPSK